MSLVLRIIVVLVGISLAVLLSVLLVNPELIKSLADTLINTSFLIRLPTAILLDAIVLAVIVILVRGERLKTPRSEGGLIVKAQGAVADVSVDSARDRLLRAVRLVPDVLSAEGEVRALHGKADVELDVAVSRENVNLPEKQKEIDRALRQVLNKQLGLQVAGKPRVHIRMDDEIAALPPVAPVVVVEPVKSEVVIAAPVKPEAVGFSSGMTMRDEVEPTPESVDPAT